MILATMENIVEEMTGTTFLTSSMITECTSIIWKLLVLMATGRWITENKMVPMITMAEAI